MALVVLCGASFYVYKTNNVSETYENKEIKKVNNNLLSMMLETEAGSGKYQKTSASSWPTEGYVFNESLSKCENGSSLSWDNAKKNVVMIGTNADKCYVYFDIKPPEFLADHIKSLYITQGENNLYLHDSTLINGAGDNSYRYAGSSETTNNFVCFGYDSKDGSCPTDNLYRIIGVFDDQVKLIKYDYAKSTLLGTDGAYDKTNVGFLRGTNKGENDLKEIGSYYWNYYWNGDNTVWSTSLLNTINLNKNYIKNIGNIWENKIAAYTWIVGGNYEENITKVNVSKVYENEIVNPKKNYTYDAKIGLMYVNDYGYAASPSAWTTNLVSYNDSSILDVNWMYMGVEEFTITREENGYDPYVFYIIEEGYIVPYYHADDSGVAVRPCFYLNSDVSYTSGKGTKTEPYLIN